MSFNIALTGLNAVSAQLDNISNNIANAGTTGFKSSRTQFGSLYAGNMAMGVNVLGSSQTINLGGHHVGTGNSLNMAISGGGFFVAQNSAGNITYTRSGDFGVDKQSRLLSGTGDFLQGYTVDADGRLMVGIVVDMQLQNTNLAARATDGISFVANLDSGKTAIPRTGTPTPPTFDPDDIDSYHDTYTTKVFDSQGNQHTLTQYFVKRDDNEWEVYYYADNAAVGAPQTLAFNVSGGLVAPVGLVDINLTFPGVAPMTVALDYSRSSQYASAFAVTTNKPNGNTAGEFTSVSIEKDGKIYATYSNGERMIQGQLILATFPNNQGLLNGNGTTWTETGESGVALLGVPGTGLFGALETSNVEMTAELVGLMEGQRNYQANSKVLSTHKELTQVLFNAI
jgi:flagellar hook protein FlgE